MDSLERKYRRLKKIIRTYPGLLVAYSGGVDSTLLLRIASEVLGDRVLAVTADSATYPRAELVYAKKLARRMGVRHRVVKSDELADERFVSNPADRCYWCKRELLKKLNDIAAWEGIGRVAIAAQADDQKDYRPGEKAAYEAGVAAPLREARLGKDDIRLLSKRICLPGWRREAMPCLASRFPYGERIGEKKLKMVERGEAFLRRGGFRNVRIRCHGQTARIEVDPDQVGRFLKPAMRRRAVRQLKKLGFLYISVDLMGYRMGSLNAPLGKKGLESSAKVAILGCESGACP